MEEFFYIILLVIWLVISLYKRSAKAKAKADKSASQPEASSTTLPKGSELEEMLEEFFGSGKKQTQPVDKEVLSDAEVVYDFEEMVSEQGSRREPVLRDDPEPAYQAWESRAQRDYNERQEGEKKEEAVAEPAYVPFYKDQGADTESFVAMEKVASVDDLIRSHAAKDAREQARAEMEYGGGLAGDLPEFDLRTAVIFSEILNRKYS